MGTRGKQIEAGVLLTLASSQKYLGQKRNVPHLWDLQSGFLKTLATENEIPLVLIHRAKAAAIFKNRYMKMELEVTAKLHLQVS